MESSKNDGRFVKIYDLSEFNMRNKEFTEEEFREYFRNYFGNNEFIREELRDSYGPIGSLMLCSSCNNLSNLAPKTYDCTATDVETTINFNEPINWNLDNVEYCRYMFAGMTEFNQNMTHLDVRKVKDMDSMFLNCKKFNQPITFNSDNLRSTKRMFMACTSFDSPIDINMENVNISREMFFGCAKFNQNVSHFNVSTLVDAGRMFMNCKEYNKPLDWLHSSGNIKDISEMFRNCKKFNKPVMINLDSVVEKNMMLKNTGQKVEEYSHSNYTDDELSRSLLDNVGYFSLVKHRKKISNIKQLLHKLTINYESEMYSFDKLISSLEPISEEREYFGSKKKEKQADYLQQKNILDKLLTENTKEMLVYDVHTTRMLQDNYGDYMIDKWKPT